MYDEVTILATNDCFSSDADSSSATENAVKQEPVSDSPVPKTAIQEAIEVAMEPCDFEKNRCKLCVLSDLYMSGYLKNSWTFVETAFKAEKSFTDEEAQQLFLNVIYKPLNYLCTRINEFRSIDLESGFYEKMTVDDIRTHFSKHSSITNGTQAYEARKISESPDWTCLVCDQMSFGCICLDKSIEWSLIASEVRKHKEGIDPAKITQLYSELIASPVSYVGNSKKLCKCDYVFRSPVNKNVNDFSVIAGHVKGCMLFPEKHVPSIPDEDEKAISIPIQCCDDTKDEKQEDMKNEETEEKPPICVVTDRSEEKKVDAEVHGDGDKGKGCRYCELESKYENDPYIKSCINLFYDHLKKSKSKNNKWIVQVVEFIMSKAYMYLVYYPIYGMSRLRSVEETLDVQTYLEKFLEITNHFEKHVEPSGWHKTLPDVKYVARASYCETDDCYGSKSDYLNCKCLYTDGFKTLIKSIIDKFCHHFDESCPSQLSINQEKFDELRGIYKNLTAPYTCLAIDNSNTCKCGKSLLVPEFNKKYIQHIKKHVSIHPVISSLDVSNLKYDKLYAVPIASFIIKERFPPNDKSVIKFPCFRIIQAGLIRKVIADIVQKEYDNLFNIIEQKINNHLDLKYMKRYMSLCRNSKYTIIQEESALHDLYFLVFSIKPESPVIEYDGSLPDLISVLKNKSTMIENNKYYKELFSFCDDNNLISIKKENMHDFVTMVFHLLGCGDYTLPPLEDEDDDEDDDKEINNEKTELQPSVKEPDTPGKVNLEGPSDTNRKPFVVNSLCMRDSKYKDKGFLPSISNLMKGIEDEDHFYLKIKKWSALDQFIELIRDDGRSLWKDIYDKLYFSNGPDARLVPKDLVKNIIHFISYLHNNYCENVGDVFFLTGSWAGDLISGKDEPRNPNAGYISKKSLSYHLISMMEPVADYHIRETIDNRFICLETSDFSAITHLAMKIVKFRPFLITHLPISSFVDRETRVMDLTEYLTYEGNNGFRIVENNGLFFLIHLCGTDWLTEVDDFMFSDNKSYISKYALLKLAKAISSVLDPIQPDVTILIPHECNGVTDVSPSKPNCISVKPLRELRTVLNHRHYPESESNREKKEEKENEKEEVNLFQYVFELKDDICFVLEESPTIKYTKLLTSSDYILKDKKIPGDYYILSKKYLRENAVILKRWIMVNETNKNVVANKWDTISNLTGLSGDYGNKISKEIDFYRILYRAVDNPKLKKSIITAGTLQEGIVKEVVLCKDKNVSLDLCNFSKNNDCGFIIESQGDISIIPIQLLVSYLDHIESGNQSESEKKSKESEPNALKPMNLLAGCLELDDRYCLVTKNSFILSFIKESEPGLSHHIIQEYGMPDGSIQLEKSRVIQIAQMMMKIGGQEFNLMFTIEWDTLENCIRCDPLLKKRITILKIGKAVSKNGLDDDIIMEKEGFFIRYGTEAIECYKQFRETTCEAYSVWNAKHGTFIKEELILKFVEYFEKWKKEKEKTKNPDGLKPGYPRYIDRSEKIQVLGRKNGIKIYDYDILEIIIESPDKNSRLKNCQLVLSNPDFKVDLLKDKNKYIFKSGSEFALLFSAFENTINKSKKSYNPEFDIYQISEDSFVLFTDFIINQPNP